MQHDDLGLPLLKNLDLLEKQVRKNYNLSIEFQVALETWQCEWANELELLKTGGSVNIESVEDALSDLMREKAEV